MRSREKALDGVEDAPLMEVYWTAGVRENGTRKGICIIFRSMEPRNALLEHLKSSLGKPLAA